MHLSPSLSLSAVHFIVIDANASILSPFVLSLSAVHSIVINANASILSPFVFYLSVKNCGYQGAEYQMLISQMTILLEYLVKCFHSRNALIKLPLVKLLV